MHQNTPTEKTTENQQLRTTGGYKNLNRFSVAPMLDGIYCSYISIRYGFAGCYWCPDTPDLFWFITAYSGV